MPKVIIKTGETQVAEGMKDLAEFAESDKMSETARRQNELFFAESFADYTSKLHGPQGTTAERMIREKGLRAETIAEHRLGLAYYQDRTGRTAPNVIIPSGPSSYIAVNILTGETTTAGKDTGIFNGARLDHEDPSKKVYIVGDVFSALLLEQEKIPAIAVLKSYDPQVIQHLATCEKDLVILEGTSLHRSSEELANQWNDGRAHVIQTALKQEGKAIKIRHLGSYTGALELYQSSPDLFRHELGKEEDEELPTMAEYMKTTLRNDLSGFTATATCTGFRKLDEGLGGSLFAGVYTIAAGSGQGKTTLALMIADNVAEHTPNHEGKPVLFFSLEMSKLELFSKSLSRLYWQTYKKKLSSLEIRKAYRPQAGTRQDNELDGVAAYYFEHIAKRLHVIEAAFNVTAEEIRQTVAGYIAKNNESPLVIVDYLQAIAQPENFRGGDQEGIELSMKALKSISRDYQTPIILLSSVNRASYAAPISFSSSKGSGSIEFTSDAFLGLEYSIIRERADLFSDEKKDKATIIRRQSEIDKAQRETPRRVSLVLLKNRYGSTFHAVENSNASNAFPFQYYPEVDFFREEEKKEIQPAEDDPQY